MSKKITKRNKKYNPTKSKIINHSLLTGCPTNDIYLFENKTPLTEELIKLFIDPFSKAIEMLRTVSGRPLDHVVLVEHLHLYFCILTHLKTIPFLSHVDDTSQMIFRIEQDLYMDHFKQHAESIVSKLSKQSKEKIPNYYLNVEEVKELKTIVERYRQVLGYLDLGTLARIVKAQRDMIIRQAINDHSKKDDTWTCYRILYKLPTGKVYSVTEGTRALLLRALDTSMGIGPVFEDMNKNNAHVA